MAHQDEGRIVKAIPCIDVHTQRDHLLAHFLVTPPACFAEGPKVVTGVERIVFLQLAGGYGLRFLGERSLNFMLHYNHDCINIQMKLAKRIVSDEAKVETWKWRHSAIGLSAGSEVWLICGSGVARGTLAAVAPSDQVDKQ